MVGVGGEQGFNMCIRFIEFSAYCVILRQKLFKIKSYIQNNFYIINMLLLTYFKTPALSANNLMK